MTMSYLAVFDVMSFADINILLFQLVVKLLLKMLGIVSCSWLLINPSNPSDFLEMSREIGWGPSSPLLKVFSAGKTRPSFCVAWLQISKEAGLCALYQMYTRNIESISFSAMLSFDNSRHRERLCSCQKRAGFLSEMLSVWKTSSASQGWGGLATCSHLQHGHHVADSLVLINAISCVGDVLKVGGN